MLTLHQKLFSLSKWNYIIITLLTIKEIGTPYTPNYLMEQDEDKIFGKIFFNFFFMFDVIFYFQSMVDYVF